MSRRARWLLAASALVVLIAALAWAWLVVALRPGDGDETLAVSVSYMTTCAREAVTLDGARYGGRRGERSFGTCTMRFRPIPGARDVAERLQFWIPTERRSVAQATEHPRLGQAGETLTVLPGVETIDVTPVGRYQLSGHVYHYYHPIVAADLVTLLLAKPHAGERGSFRRVSVHPVRGANVRLKAKSDFLVALASPIAHFLRNRKQT